MTGHTCVVCGNSSRMDPKASFHRFPSNPERRSTWLRVFGMEEQQLRTQSRVCSRHFPDGDTKKDPSLTLGKRFASPVKVGEPRAKRARSRELNKVLVSWRGSVPPVGSFTGISLKCWNRAVLPAALYQSITCTHVRTKHCVYTFLHCGTTPAWQNPSSKWIEPIYQGSRRVSGYITISRTIDILNNAPKLTFKRSRSSVH